MARIKREVPQEEFDKFLSENKDLVFDGMRYTVPVQMKGGTWNKPVAAKVDGKLILIEDK